jgi:hypothetical protein
VCLIDYSYINVAVSPTKDDHITKTNGKFVAAHFAAAANSPCFVRIYKIIVVGDGDSNMFQFYFIFLSKNLFVTRTHIRFNINPKHSICQIWLFVGEFEMGVGNGNYNIFGAFEASSLQFNLYH